MPGVASLEALQYYAHPRNAFWPIMGELFGIDHDCNYEQRIEQIRVAPVILWDTLKGCERPGSLDSNIRRESVEANDITALLEEYREVVAVTCNGSTSANYFRKLVLPHLSRADEIELLQMPSTSPANAGMSFEQKLDAWRRLLDHL